MASVQESDASHPAASAQGGGGAEEQSNPAAATPYSPPPVGVHAGLAGYAAPRAQSTGSAAEEGLESAAPCGNAAPAVSTMLHDAGAPAEAGVVELAEEHGAQHHVPHATAAPATGGAAQTASTLPPTTQHAESGALNEPSSHTAKETVTGTLLVPPPPTFAPAGLSSNIHANVAPTPSATGVDTAAVVTTDVPAVHVFAQSGIADPTLLHAVKLEVEDRKRAADEEAAEAREGSGAKRGRVEAADTVPTHSAHGVPAGSSLNPTAATTSTPAMPAHTSSFLFPAAPALSSPPQAPAPQAVATSADAPRAETSADTAGQGMGRVREPARWIPILRCSCFTCTCSQCHPCLRCAMPTPRHPCDHIFFLFSFACIFLP